MAPHLRDLPDDYSSTVVVVLALYMSSTIIAVTLRLGSRKISQASFWWDDGFAIFSVVSFLSDYNIFQN